ncbi:hypothetical protein CCR85_06035 [Rhodothalassium salexigens]|uniref:DUF6491 family protein n=1 Tax=Rhodothalassium salexigens TaxID=1086 RepID=UPI0019140457|nr:DUF6491 family protein [Rhodothalassium salexigens]MBK5911049.1 hypothetical protein [Rhodothalassium salexigens]MBK5920995.1 hypothetical protein [Rhodothalassium salexigens]
MRATFKTILAAGLLATAATTTASAGDSVSKHDIGYWTAVDADTLVLYDWSKRNKYRAELSEPCPAAFEGKPAKLAATHMGRLQGAFRDRITFGRTSCGIASIEQLTPEQYASLVGDKVELAEAR